MGEMDGGYGRELGSPHRCALVRYSRPQCRLAPQMRAGAIFAIAPDNRGPDLALSAPVRANRRRNGRDLVNGGLITTGPCNKARNVPYEDFFLSEARTRQIAFAVLFGCRWTFVRGRR